MGPSLLEERLQANMRAGVLTFLSSSLGYGNVAPKTPAGRLFCVFYGLFGVPLCLTWISALGKFFGGRAKRLGQFLTRRGVSLVWPHPKWEWEGREDVGNCTEAGEWAAWACAPSQGGIFQGCYPAAPSTIPGFP